MELIEKLTDQVMQLPVGQRLAIAHRILASVDEQFDAGAQAEWDREIHARIERYEADPDSALSGPAVFVELDKKLGR